MQNLHSVGGCVMRDKQRQKVYDWEDSQSWMVKKSYLTQDQCSAVIKRLNKIFKRQITLRFKNGRGKCFASRNEIVIRNKWGRSYGVLLHEYAHHLSDDLHGRKFVSEYCLLLHCLHPDQPSIKDLVASMNDANVEFRDFERTLSKKVLSKRLKSFQPVCTNPIPEPKRYIKKRTSPKQRVQKLLEQWSDYYGIAEYDHYGFKLVNINEKEYGVELDTWKEVEECMLEAIEQKLHLHEDYQWEEC